YSVFAFPDNFAVVLHVGVAFSADNQHHGIFVQRQFFHHRFVQQFGNQLAKLEPFVSVLQSDPEQFEQLKEDYAYSQQMQRDARQQAFALTEVVQR
ncbi:hypothetical protein NE471_28670, partial [Escherichia coli]|uniref:hypothetical protein n=1 Tax=Escherichia coli TaxID=562 RepID=UPI00210A4610